MLSPSMAETILVNHKCMYNLCITPHIYYILTNNVNECLPKCFAKDTLLEV